MKDTVKPLGTFVETGKHLIRKPLSEEMIRYYSVAGIDYEPWSASYNMHFGYYRKGINPCDREALVNEMNAQVLGRLRIEHHPLAQLIDLGCGVGATTRYCASKHTNTLVTGVTVIPWQIEKAKDLTDRAKLNARISYNLVDYCHTPFPEHSFDGAFAIESSCYAGGTNKASFLKEAFRILKPGSRLVVADGFRKREQGSTLFEKAFQLVCKGWSLDTFANIQHFAESMEKIGFEDITVEEASWKVFPSVLHVPWVSLRYYFKKILFQNGARKVQKNHLIAPLMGMVIGMHRKDYGYYLVSAKKPSF